MKPPKYLIYKAMIGWSVVCPCRGLLFKSMTFDGAVKIFRTMLKNGVC